MDARTTAGGAVDSLRLRCAPRRIVWALFLPALLAGCQADANMQLVERELRLQDSHIFELEEHLADCHSAVAAHRREIDSLRRQLDGAIPPSVDDYDGEWDADARLRPPRPSTPGLPKIEEGDDIPSFRRPAPAPMDDATPLDDYDAPDATEVPAVVPLPEEDTPPAPIVDPDGDADEVLPTPSLDGAAEDVEQIGLRLMVRYHAAENTPVELQTLVEPQDRDAQQVAVAGDVSLMVVATDDGTERPLARWDYSREQVQDHWGTSRLGTGMAFQLPWPGTPQAGTYRLWARMVGADGRKHLSSADFEVHDAALANRPQEPRHAELVRPEPQPHGGPEWPELLAQPSGTERDTPPQAESDSDETQPSTLSPPEANAASSTNIAWKASVEAARLPRLPQPRRVSVAAADEDASSQMNDGGRLIPWSPERPTALGGEAQTAGAGEWSPYR